MARVDFRGVDLFGQPVPAVRTKAGRPEHEWSVENSNRINLLFATGHELRDAAQMLGISLPTLRKHYFSEVEQWRVARLKLKALQLERLHDEGAKGNVGAIKELLKQAERGALVARARELATPAPEKKAPAEKLGKKATAKAAAADVRGKFAPPAPPRLIN